MPQITNYVTVTGLRNLVPVSTVSNVVTINIYEEASDITATKVARLNGEVITPTTLVKSGDIIEFTITFVNDGAAITSLLTLSDILDSNLTYIDGSIEGTGVTISLTTVSSANVLQVTMVSLASGATGVIKFECEVD